MSVGGWKLAMAVDLDKVRQIAERLAVSEGLFLVDVESKVSREVLSVAPDGINNARLSRDGRQLFIVRGANEADVWLSTLE